jgi:hypothetical protein
MGVGGMVLTGETKILGKKSRPVPLFPPQKSHGPSRDRTQASAVKDWQLTVRAVAQPN